MTPIPPDSAAASVPPFTDGRRGDRAVPPGHDGTVAATPGQAPGVAALASLHGSADGALAGVVALSEHRHAFRGIISEVAEHSRARRPLTHSLDWTEEGLAMQATRVRTPITDPAIGQAANDDSLCKCGCGQVPPLRRRKGRERLQYARGHFQQHLRKLAAQDFWTKVNVRGQDECWPWAGRISEKGYGVVKRHSRTSRAHKIAYLLAVGPVPAGLTLDHLCHERGEGCPGGTRCLHRRCCNPAHLKPVTADVNTMRGMSPPALNALKDKCIHGHLFTEANTRILKNGGRACRECGRENHRKLAAKRREARRLNRAA